MYSYPFEIDQYDIRSIVHVSMKDLLDNRFAFKAETLSGEINVFAKPKKDGEQVVLGIGI